MRKQIMTGALVGVLAVVLTASSAFAFRCPKLIGAGRRLAKTYVMGTDQAIKLLNEAESLHKSGKHKAAMQKGTDAIAILTK